jgi:hypothetical protein
VNNEHNKKSVRVFFAGGTGINIGGGIDFAVMQGQLDIFVTYIDVSRSNIENVHVPVNPSNCYLFDGEDLDGSGKHRPENHKVVESHIPEILLQHKPADYNIIVCGAGGGSGSVIGPELHSALLARDEWVMSFVVGSAASYKELINTIGTINSYRGISQIRKKVALVGYYQNSQDMKKSDVDNRIAREIIALITLFSMSCIGTTGLDTADLSHWLNYEKVTTQAPQLSLFTVMMNGHTDVLDELGEPVAVATLATNKNTADFPTMVDYHGYGLLPEDDDELNAMAPIHYVNSIGFFDRVLDELIQIRDGRKAANEARTARMKTRTIDAPVTRSGLVIE